VGDGVGWRVGVVVVMVRSRVVGVGAAVVVGSLGCWVAGLLGCWQSATARAMRPRVREAMVRIGRMATSLVVLPFTIAPAGLSADPAGPRRCG